MELQSKDTERLIAITKRQKDIESILPASPIADTEGLAQNEVVALVSVAQNIDSPDDFAYIHSIRNDMYRAGFTPL